MAGSKRRRRESSPVRTLILLALLGAAVFLLLRPSLLQLRSEHARLRARFTTLLQATPAFAATPGGEAALGIPLPYVRNLVETIAPSWLNEARLSLGGIKVHETGELKKKTLLGEMRLGEWRLDLDIHSVHAVLRAGRPQLTPGAGGRIAVRLPITIVRGRGEATVRFGWDAAGVASVVCRDFDLTRKVVGDVMPETHTVSGEFAISSAHGAVLAEPRLFKQPWRVRVRPSKATQDAVRAALAEQDSFFKCGIALNPDDVMRKLDELLARGVEVQLPALGLPALKIPAAFQYSLERGSQPVDLAVSSEDLRVSPQYIWLAASIKASRRAAPVVQTPVVPPAESPTVGEPSPQPSPPGDLNTPAPSPQDAPTVPAASPLPEGAVDQQGAPSPRPDRPPEGGRAESG